MNEKAYGGYIKNERRMAKQDKILKDIKEEIAKKEAEKANSLFNFLMGQLLDEDYIKNNKQQ